jgi:hypothetical protein
LFCFVLFCFVLFANLKLFCFHSTCSFQTYCTLQSFAIKISFKKIKFPEKLFFSISFSYSPVAVQLYTKEQQQ